MVLLACAGMVYRIFYQRYDIPDFIRFLLGGSMRLLLGFLLRLQVWELIVFLAHHANFSGIESR